MKKLSKTLLAVAAVSAVSAAMAVSASAMTASYADGTVTLADVNASGDQQTILVLSSNDTVVEEGNIKQIDQKEGTFESVPVGTLTDGTYYVRVGGTDGSLQTAEFKVGNDDPNPPAPATETITVGDIDGADGIDGTDSIMMARYIAKSDKAKGNAGAVKVLAAAAGELAVGADVIVGDVDFADGIDGTDSIMVARYIAKSEKAKGHTGETITVEAAAAE